MVTWFPQKRFGPIGVDIGSRSLKLIQFTADRQKLVDAVRWDVPALADEGITPEARTKALCEAIRQARDGRKFRGREAVMCLGSRELFVQNIRVSKVPGPEFDRLICQEAASRIPFAAEEAEVRFLQAADVRQGDVTKREVILLACHRPVLEQTLKIGEGAGLLPVAVDIEPAALLRSYVKQLRRDEDRQTRAMFAHVGATSTVVVIAQGNNALFVKYIDVGGRQMDEAVAKHLQMTFNEAAALRRHNGDRRVEQQDPEIARSVAESIRPVIDRLAGELSLCMRYHSVTFRGQPLTRAVLGGGEATSGLAEDLTTRLDVKCELGDPLRTFEAAGAVGRRGQWDVAAGLALRELK